MNNILNPRPHSHGDRSTITVGQIKVKDLCILHKTLKFFITKRISFENFYFEFKKLSSRYIFQVKTSLQSKKMIIFEIFSKM